MNTNTHSPIIGRVSSEGGPFLIGDAAALLAWRGIDSSDYDGLCELLGERSSCMTTINGRALLAWDAGAGTVSVARLPGGVMRITQSLGDLCEEDCATESSSLEAEPVGVISVDAELGIVWAANSMAEIALGTNGYIGELATGDSAIVLPHIFGVFRASADRVGPNAMVRRLTLAPGS